MKKQTKKFILIVFIILFLLIIFLSVNSYKKLFIPKYPNLNMEIASSEFYNNGEIPKEYTCQGEDITPYLKISEIPKEAKTLVLIMDDPDAKRTVGRVWVHWIAFDIPVSGSEIEFNEEQDIKKLGGKEGITDFKKIGYGGPCPPEGSGVHHYYFKIYALDSELGLQEGTAKKQIEKAMEKKVIEKAELIGTYER